LPIGEKTAQSGLNVSGQTVPNGPGIGQQGERAGWEQVTAVHEGQTVSMCDSGNGTERSTQSGLGDLADGLSRWLVEPDIPRVATGIKDRTNKLKALGNAVVPQQVYPILKAIYDIMQHSCNTTVTERGHNGDR
jgi:hypothetical protein